MRLGLPLYRNNYTYKEINPMNSIVVIVRVTSLIHSALPAGDDMQIIAMASAICNRLKRGDQLESIVGGSLLSNKCLSELVSSSPAPEAFLRCLSLTAGTFAGRYDDPTDGAIRFHRHDQAPAWAKRHESYILLGAHFYYHD